LLQFANILYWFSINISSSLPTYVLCLTSISHHDYFLTGGKTFELPSAAQDVVVKAVSSAVAICPLPHLMKHQMALLLVAEDDTNLPDELQTLMNRFCPLLLSPTRAIQLAAYNTLMR